MHLLLTQKFINVYTLLFCNIVNKHHLCVKISHPVYLPAINNSEFKVINFQLSPHVFLNKLAKLLNDN